MGPSGTMGSKTWFLCLNFGYDWGEFWSRKLTDILFYMRDIPLSTRTISEYNLIKWCQWDHLLDRILIGLRVRATGLKVFMVSINDLVCQLCIGCSLSLSNNGTKLCIITDILVLSYSFWLVHVCLLVNLFEIFLRPGDLFLVPPKLPCNLFPGVNGHPNIWC